jgi:hypothetical protein
VKAEVLRLALTALPRAIGTGPMVEIVRKLHVGAEGRKFAVNRPAVYNDLAMPSCGPWWTRPNRRTASASNPRGTAKLSEWLADPSRWRMPPNEVWAITGEAVRSGLSSKLLITHFLAALMHVQVVYRANAEPIRRTKDGIGMRDYECEYRFAL